MVYDTLSATMRSSLRPMAMSTVVYNARGFDVTPQRPRVSCERKINTLEEPESASIGVTFPSVSSIVIRHRPPD